MKGDKNLFNLFRSSHYRKIHKKNDFPIYGLELVLGKFGSGKTATIVNRVYDYLELFPKCRVISNVDFKNLKHDNFYYTDNEYDFLNTCIDVLSTNVDDGCIVVIDEVKLFLSETLRDDKSQRCNAFITILGQVRKLHCLFLITSQLYNKVPKVLRDFILQNGDIVLCKKLLPRFNLLYVL